MEMNLLLILRAECCIFRADSIYCNHQQEMQQGYTIILWEHGQEQWKEMVIWLALLQTSASVWIQT